MSIRFVVLAIALAVQVIGRPALADDKEAARRSYLEGTRRYDLNEFGPALEAFKRAYLDYEDPAFLYNIAQCYRQLGDKENALKFYRSFLRKLPDAPNREEVTGTIATLDAALAAEKATAPPPRVVPSPATQDFARPTTVTESPVATAPPPKQTPVYKKWWLWTIVGVVAAGAATGVAVGVTSKRTESSFMPITVTQ
jgi:tetratricopeptide (TPR) repeat protein